MPVHTNRQDEEGSNKTKEKRTKNAVIYEIFVSLLRYFSVKGRRPIAIFTHMAPVSSLPSKQSLANAVPQFKVI